MSDGALCVFLDGYTGREGKPVPLIIRKSDGGYGYATTDLATIRHRVRDLDADRILYVIGAPQALHLQMVWDTARKAGWLPRRRRGACTSRSATCSAPTARSCAPAAAPRCG